MIFHVSEILSQQIVCSSLEFVIELRVSGSASEDDAIQCELIDWHSFWQGLFYFGLIMTAMLM